MGCDRRCQIARGLLENNRRKKLVEYVNSFKTYVSPKYFSTVSDWAIELANEQKYPLSRFPDLRRRLSLIFDNAGNDSFDSNAGSFAQGKNIVAFMRERAPILYAQEAKLQKELDLFNEREATRKQVFNELIQEFPFVLQEINTNALKDYGDSTLEDAIAKIDEYLTWEKSPITGPVYKFKSDDIKKELKKRANEYQDQMLSGSNSVATTTTGEVVSNTADQAIEAIQETTADQAIEAIQETKVGDVVSKVGKYKWALIGGGLGLVGLLLILRRK